MAKATFEHDLETKRPNTFESHYETTRQPRIKLSTDGACIGNPGPGGWACVLRFDDRTCEIFGSHPDTTSNRMELQAVIEALKRLEGQPPHSITAFTDSTYLQRGATLWLPNWKARGWMTAKGRDVANRGLWEELDRLKARHTIDWRWVRGHGNDLDNLRSDYLANKAAMEQISGLKILPA
jgi:ribonuclease HI